MLRFYPSFTHEMNNLRAINGSHTGILKSLVAPVTKIHKEPFLKSVTGSMPHYHRFILGDPEKDMNYHLSGYGRFYQEALIKFNGESVERYAGVTSSSYASTNIVYASYDEMCKKGPTMPLEYINIFSPEQQKQMNQLMPRYSPVHLRSDQTIAWVKGHSLVYPGEDIWVPRQQFFVGYEHFEGDNDPVFVPSFSTGTAAHKTTKKAMINAITEYLQIDAFIMSWYLMRKSPKVVIDNPIVLKMLEDSGLDADSPYDVIPLLVTMWIEATMDFPRKIVWIFPFMSACCEEIFFRGACLFSFLFIGMPEMMAIILVTALFLANQLYLVETPVQAIVIGTGSFFLSVMGCMLVLLTNSIIPSMLMHAIYAAFFVNNNASFADKKGYVQ